MGEQTEGVQHGIHSWIDHDKSWINRDNCTCLYMFLVADEQSKRQFLVTERHAYVLSTMLAVALTLAGPCLWILIKAFLSWLNEIFRAQPGFVGSEDSIQLRDIISLSLDTTSEARSELGAGRDLLEHVYKEARSGRIRLPNHLLSAFWRRSVHTT